MDQNQEAELFETLHFIKDRMVTKDELREGLDGLRSEVKGDIARQGNDINRLGSKIDNFIDLETDNRKKLEVRVSNIETKVSTK